MSETLTEIPVNQLTADNIDAMAAAFHYFIYSTLPPTMTYRDSWMNETIAAIKYARDELGLTDLQIDIYYCKVAELINVSTNPTWYKHKHDRVAREYTEFMQGLRSKSSEPDDIVEIRNRNPDLQPLFDSLDQGKLIPPV